MDGRTFRYHDNHEFFRSATAVESGGSSPLAQTPTVARKPVSYTHLDVYKRQLQVVPATKVLFLSAHNDEAYIVEAVNAGAMGYLIKQTSADCVCAAIREVQKGNTFFSPSIPKRLHKRNWEK